MKHPAPLVFLAVALAMATATAAESKKAYIIAPNRIFLDLARDFIWRSEYVVRVFRLEHATHVALALRVDSIAPLRESYKTIKDLEAAMVKANDLDSDQVHFFLYEIEANGTLRRDEHVKVTAKDE